MAINYTVIIIVAVYLIAMLFIGWYSYTKISSNEDFMVAGRRLGPVLMAGTLAATEIGGGSSLGVVEKAYGDWGMGASWYIITMAITFGFLTFLGSKFRQSMVKTVPEYFRRRYGRPSGAITSVIMIIPLIGLTATQFIASSTIISVMLGVDYRMAVILVSVVVTIYAVMGGLWSVTLTDFIQVFLIVFGMMIAIPFALKTVGGWDNVVATLPKEKFAMVNSSINPKTIISLIVMYLASFTVGQEAVSRYYAARDDKAAVQGSLLAGLINIIYAFIPTVLGLITLALVTNGTIPKEMIMKDGPKYALPLLAMHTMPSLVIGLLFSGIISATMSSADSDLLGAGSIFGNDIYKIYIKPHATSNEVMRTTKITMLVIGFLAMIVALTNKGSLIKLLTLSFTLRAAGAFFPYVLGHYWKRASGMGTVVSLLLGSFITLYVEIRQITIFGLREPIIPGLVASFLAFLILTLLFPNKKNSTELVGEEDF
jgi:SSS family solute:Na+ symporter